MKAGDAVLYYHSGDERAIVGNATVAREAFPDPTMEADEQKGAWVAVALKAGRAFKNPLALTAVKTDEILRNMVLAKNSRLSVMPVSAAEFDHIVRMAS